MRISALPITLLLICMLIPGFSIGADDITLSGVDSRLTSVTGIVNLYAVVTDSSGMPLENLSPQDFTVIEALPDGTLGEAQDIVNFSSAGERRNGISFMMLIDDSGSMYDGPDGFRAALARREARNFLDSLGSSMDRAGLAVFGTHYHVLAGPRTDRASLFDRLGKSSPPEADEAYTELYASIVEASNTLSTQKGRRIIILFSDGENYPYFERSGKIHTDYGDKTFISDDALNALQMEGITLYAVRFGSNRDEDLARIAMSTGGVVFDVNGEEELSGLYAAIRERVLAEYRLGYRPGPSGAEETSVLVELRSGPSSAALSYPSGFVFGTPSTRSEALMSLLAIPFVLLILFSLAWRGRKKTTDIVTLERLRPVGGGQVTVALQPGKTVISPGIAGEATSFLAADAKTGDVKTGDAKSADVKGGSTILVEKGKDGQWRISSDEGVIVNNRKLDATVLENGDVIKAGEELIVFDNGES